MTQQDEIIQDAAPQKTGQVLKIALLASVLLHLSVLVVSEKSSSVERTMAETTLHVSLISQPRWQEQQHDVSQALEQHPPVPLALPSPDGPELVTINEVESDIQKTENKKNKPAESFSTSAWAMVKAYLAQKTTETLGREIRSCDLAQRASKIRKCELDDEELWRYLDNKRYDGTFDVEFSLSTTVRFRRDMALVDDLMKKQQFLDEIVKEEGFEPDDIAEMRREIREKINRIDGQYAQINLLKVLGIGKKVAVKLWQATKSKK